MYKDLLEGIVTYLNDPARGFSQSFTAVREWHPEYEMESITGLEVKAFAVEDERVRTERVTGWRVEKSLGVHVVSRATTETQIDDLVTLSDEIRNELCGLTPIAGYGLVRMDSSDVFNLEAMHQAQVFVNVTQLIMASFI